MLTLCTVISLYLHAIYSIPPQLEGLQLSDSALAASWEHTKVVPGQIISVRFCIKHSQVLGENYSMDCELLNPHGQRVVHVNQPVKQMKSSTYTENWQTFAIQTPTSLEPGDYQIAVTIQSPQCTVQPKERVTVTVTPMKLAFALCSFSYDPQGRIPAAPMHLQVMQPMLVRFAIVGLGVAENQVHYRCTLQVLNMDGELAFEINPPEARTQATLLPGQTTSGAGGYFTSVMTTPGKYRYRIKVIDMNTWDAASKEIPVQFHAPQ